MNRVIHVAYVVTNCKNTGPIHQTYNLIRHMNKTEFKVTLITLWAEDRVTLLEEYRKLGIDVYQLNMTKASSVIYGYARVSRLLKMIKPDIVQGVGIPPYRMTLGYKKCIHMVTLRNYCFEDYPDQYGKIGTVLAWMDIGLISRKMKKGEPFVTCSKSLSDIYESKHGMKIDYICNGVDVSRYLKRDSSQKGDIRRRLGLPPDKLIFVYSGRLIDRKNQQEAISAFKKLGTASNTMLLILGDGPNREMLENMSADSSNICFHGQVNNISEYLQACDVYLATSRSEGLPNGVLEAMATGLPVLLSDIPQHLEVLSAGDGFGTYYHLGDDEALADRIRMMIQSDLIAMGENSYKVLHANFTAEIMSANYQKLYRSVVR